MPFPGDHEFFNVTLPICYNLGIDWLQLFLAECDRIHLNDNDIYRMFAKFQILHHLWILLNLPREQGEF